MSATTSVAKINGRNSRTGDRPAAFITMISESVASLFSVCEIATNPGWDPLWPVRRIQAGITSHYHPFDPSTKWLGQGGLRIWLIFWTSDLAATVVGGQSQTPLESGNCGWSCDF